MPPTRSSLLGLILVGVTVVPVPIQAQQTGTSDFPGPSLAASLEEGTCPYGTDTLRSGWIRDELAEFRRAAAVAGRAPMDRGGLDQLAEDRRTGVCRPGGGGAWGSHGNPARVSVGPAAVTALPVQQYSVYNSLYPRSPNDGALWAGRGLSASLRGGVRAEWGPLTAALAPSLHYQQNRGFELPRSDLAPVQPGRAGSSRLRYPWQAGIDWPLRFGFQPLVKARLGQSYVRLEQAGLAASASTENLWVGPATRYPLIMSSTAGGFPHLSFGTDGPVDVGIGTLEVQLTWGWLEESDHFDAAPANDTRILNLLVASFSPAGLPGLTVGGASAYQNTLPPEGLPSGEYFQAFTLPVSQQGGASQEGDGLGSIFARWVMPESGFEFYWEWGKEDFNADLEDFAKEPDHGQAWTFGLQKVWAGDDRDWVKLTAELTHLQQSMTGDGLQRGYPGGDDARPAVTWYVHGSVHQGYTNRGQLLGSYTGPGSTAQYLSLDWYLPWGRAGGFAERVRHDQDAYRAHLDDVRAFWDPDVELTVGARGTFLFDRLDLPEALAPLRPLDATATVSMSSRFDRHFIATGPAEGEQKNWRGELTLRWHP